MTTGMAPFALYELGRGERKGKEEEMGDKVRGVKRREMLLGSKGALVFDPALISPCKSAFLDDIQPPNPFYLSISDLMEVPEGFC